MNLYVFIHRLHSATMCAVKPNEHALVLIASVLYSGNGSNFCILWGNKLVVYLSVA